MGLLIRGRWEKNLVSAALGTASSRSGHLHFDDFVGNELRSDLLLPDAFGDEVLDVGGAGFVGVVDVAGCFDGLGTCVARRLLHRWGPDSVHLDGAEGRRRKVFGLRVVEWVVVRCTVLHMNCAQLLELLAILMHALIVKLLVRREKDALGLFHGRVFFLTFVR